MKAEYGSKTNLNLGRMDTPSSHTPETDPTRCPACGNEIWGKPPLSASDKSCPRCALLASFWAAAKTNDFFVSEVHELHVSTRHEAIQSLVGRLGELGRISPEANEDIVAKIMAREELGAIGAVRGIAVPHARHLSVRRTIGIVGYAPRGIDFSSLDGEPARTIIMLLSPDDKPREHLQALEWITRLLRAG